MKVTVCYTSAISLFIGFKGPSSELKIWDDSCCSKIVKQIQQNSMFILSKR